MPTRPRRIPSAPMIARIVQSRKPKIDQRLDSAGPSAVKY
jgi:hypothetical protein